MPLTEVASRLRDRFNEVTAGDPAPLPRECTLWVVIDWSHELLGEVERVLFRRLSVFAGGCTLEAATQVCASGEMEADHVPALLASLAAHSLVAFDRAAQRYRMLETVREYGAQWLAQSDEGERVRDRHLEHFAGVTAAARRALAGPDQLQWLARLDAEQENLVIAHEHAGSREALGVPGLRLVNGMKLYWTNRGCLKLGLRLTLEALRRAGVQGDTPERAQGLFNAGQLLYFMGRHGEARQCLEASLRIARGLGDAYVAAVLQPLGMAALGQADLSRARHCFVEALKLARAGGDERSVAGAMNALAMFHRVDARPGTAAQLYEDVVRISRKAGDAEAEAVGLLNLAMARIDQARMPEARTALEGAIRVAAHVRSVPGSQSALDVSAAIAALHGDSRHAAFFAGAAEAQAARSGLGRDAADAMFIEPKLARARAALGEAAYRDAAEEGRRCDLFQALRAAQGWLQRSGAIA
jgi:tetratricopeptide (TPR) repeat protein